MGRPRGDLTPGTASPTALSQAAVGYPPQYAGSRHAQHAPFGRPGESRFHGKWIAAAASGDGRENGFCKSIAARDHEKQQNASGRIDDS
jgi:hypothetical protein